MNLCPQCNEPFSPEYDRCPEDGAQLVFDYYPATWRWSLGKPLIYPASGGGAWTYLLSVAAVIAVALALHWA